MTLASILKLYNENLEHARNIARKYSLKFYEHERLEFQDAVDEGLLRGINRYLRLKTQDNESYLKRCIWSELNHSCALVAQSIVGFSIPYCKSQKKKGRSVPPVYSLDGMMEDLGIDVEHSKLTKLDYDDPFVILAAKDDKVFAHKLEKQLLKEFTQKELDSILYTYHAGFKQKYPEVNYKSHDNLQNRTKNKLKILIKKRRK
jgi:hypothetical protein